VSVETDLTQAILELVRPELQRMVADEVRARTPDPKPWLSTKEAAEYLGISEQAVRDRVYAKTLKARRSGRSLRFRRSDLDASLEPA